MPPTSTIEILGIPILQATSEQALEAVERAATEYPPALVAYVNAHGINLAAGDAGYRGTLRAADLVLNDGAGVALAARMKGRPFPENLNGSDFNPKILELAARKGWSVYFLGAHPGVAQEAAARLASRIEGLDVAGARDGFFSRSEDSQVAEQIRATGADVVMVAMGNPLQERWLAENLRATGCMLGVGVGAFFDFSAERVKRAPAWMNRLGIEWLWRLALEPARLWRRYVVGNPVFLLRATREALRERRQAR
jgi:exopolysaccharide biosynthesis WecB/TagA/CpsF family protein